MVLFRLEIKSPAKKAALPDFFWDAGEKVAEAVQLI